MSANHFLKPCPICGSNQADYERTLNGIELLNCNACDFVYSSLKDEYIKAANSKYDDRITAKYQQKQTFIDAEWFKKIVKKITSMVEKGNILDVGCGNGVLLKHFIDQEWLAYGVDLSPWAKSFAQKYGYTLYSGELENSGLPDNYFDAVTSTSTLEHISQPCQHVKQIIRVLKPGGIAYFAGIPNYGSLSIRLNISNFHSNMPPRHANYFTQKSMCRLFSYPDIADDVKKLSITSYGIPELHRIYSFLRKSMRKITATSANNRDEAIQDGSPKGKRATKPLLRKALTAILVTAHYNLGRPFDLGDKLEIIAIKR